MTNKVTVLLDKGNRIDKIIYQEVPLGKKILVSQAGPVIYDLSGKILWETFFKFVLDLVKEFDIGQIGGLEIIIREEDEEEPNADYLKELVELIDDEEDTTINDLINNITAHMNTDTYIDLRMLGINWNELKSFNK